MEHIPAGVQGSLFVDDFAVYCSGSNAFEAGRKSRLPLMLLQIGPSLKGFGFLL